MPPENLAGPSVIVPAFNASRYIKNSLTVLHDYFRKVFPAFEIIVVNDGSTDNTISIIKDLQLPNLILVDQPANLGKFGAIRNGMAKARGESCIFFDCDLPYDLSAIPYIHRLITQRKLHIVIGDRTLQESSYYGQLSTLRRISSQIFPLFVRLLVTGGLFDTQCGLKGFRTDVAKAIFSITKDNGFSGDVEVLYIALKYNLEIKRIPVRLKDWQPSNIRIIRDACKMIWACMKLPPRWRKGTYDSTVLDDISSQVYWDDRNTGNVSPV